MEAKRIRLASILLGLAVALSLMPGFAVAASADTGDQGTAQGDVLEAASSKPLQAIQANRLNVFKSDTDKNLGAKVVEGNGALSYEVTSGEDCVSVNSTGALTFKKAGTATITVTAAETDTYAKTSVDVPIAIYDHFDYTFTVGNTLDCVDYYGHYPVNKLEIKLKGWEDVLGSGTINSPQRGSKTTIRATGFAKRIEMRAEIQQRKNTRSASETLSLNGGGRFEIEMNSRGTIVMCDYGITLPEPDYVAPVAKPNLSSTGQNQLLIYPGSVLSGGQHMEYAFGTADAPNPNGWTDNYGFMRAKNPGDYYVWFKTESRDRRSLMYFSGGRLDTAPQCVHIKVEKGTINPSVNIEGWTYGETAKTPTVSGNTGNGTVTYEYKAKGDADDTYTKDVPSLPGDYTVRAIVADSTTHKGGSATTDFAIAKGTVPTQDVRVAGVMSSNDETQAWRTSITQSLAGMMPENAGSLTYEANTYTYKVNGTVQVLPAGFTFEPSVNADTGEVSAMLQITSAAADSITAIDQVGEIILPVTVKSQYYNDATINVIVVPTARTELNVTLGEYEKNKVYDDGTFELTAIVKNGDNVVETNKGDWYWYSSDPNVLEVPAITDPPSGSNTVSVTVKKPGSAQILAWYEPSDDDSIGAALTESITVNKAEITPSVALEDWTYGEPANTPTVSGNPGDGAVTYSYSGTTADGSAFGPSTVAPTLAGDYTVTATVPETANYLGATCTKNFTIKKKPVTATVAASDKTYDGTTDATVSATVDKGALVQSDLDDDALVDENGKVTISGLVGTFKDANAGTGKEIILNYDGVVSPVANAESYEVTATTETPTASIEKRTVYVGADDKSSPYGEDIVELTYGLYGPGGLAEGDSLASLGVIASTTATSSSDVGDYPITLSGGTGNDNYKVIFCEEEDTYTTYTITAADISQAKVVLSQPSYVYDGKAKEPAATVTLGSRTLAAGTDYDVAYANNTEIGTATVTLTGKGNYTGSATAEFAISEKVEPAPAERVSIAAAQVTLPQASYDYDGTAKEPAVTVTLNGKVLVAGTDYDVAYANNVQPGTAAVTVTGKGAYKDSASATFAIRIGKAKLSTTAHPSAKTIDVKWKKVPGAKKYQLQWRERGGKWKSVTVKSTKANVKSLKSGKLYDVRVRAVAGSTKGTWSAQSHRWLTLQSGVEASSSKSGAVKVTWKKTAKANAGYEIVVRYSKNGKAVATKTVKAGKTSATVKGLKPSKKAWVLVRPLRKAGTTTYSGALTRAESPVKVTGKSGAKPQSASALTAAAI